MEKFELVDEYGNKTGKILTSLEIDNRQCIPDGCFVSIVWVLILNDKNDLLLQRRSMLKKFYPGKLGVCGGKVDFNEEPIDAGVRETYEEIGVKLNRDDLKFLCTTKGEKAYITVFYVRKNIDISKCVLQKEEIDELKYFSIDKLKEIDNEGKEAYTYLKSVIDK